MGLPLPWEWIWNLFKVFFFRTLASWIRNDIGVLDDTVFWPVSRALGHLDCIPITLSKSLWAFLSQVCPRVILNYFGEVY